MFSGDGRLMNTRQRAVLALLAVLAALLFPVIGWFFLAGTMPAIHVRTVAPNGTVIACGSNGTCVYDNTIDIFNAISGSHELFGPLQVAFFVGALTGGFAVALVLLFLTYFVWGEAKGTKEEKKTTRKDSHRLDADAEKSSQQ
jgi:nitrogen fixation-related uncharacterized protein